MTPRREAQQLGLKIYSGRVHPKCGTVIKFTATGSCRACYETDRRSKSRARNLKYHRKILLEEYETQYQQQDGRCLICHMQFRLLLVDHDHQTGQIRGLLCNGCNSAIGLLKENKQLLHNAVKYLENANGS